MDVAVRGSPVALQQGVQAAPGTLSDIPEQGRRRDELKAFPKDQGIGTEVYYPLSLHQQECFKKLDYKRGDFPLSETAATETLALPVYPKLTDEQIQYVAGKVREFLG